MPNDEGKTKVLITGAAGIIGSAFFQATADRYHFRLADHLPFPEHPLVAAGEHETMVFDIADVAACQRACQGIDVVLHLAADANLDAEFYTSLLSTNIQGTYNIFRAARDQGCRRVIFASSCHVVFGYPPDVQVHPESPLRPANMYGVSKSFGEALAAYFAYQEGLSTIVVRIGAYDAADPARNLLRLEPNVRDFWAYVSERDLQHLFIRCIEAENIPFAIAHGVSDNRFKRLDITSTREQLGYHPQDDAFDVFAENLQDWLNN